MSKELTDRQVAAKLISRQLQAICGLTLADISDTPTVCEQLDLMEEHCANAYNDDPLSQYEELAADCAVVIMQDAGIE